MNSRKHQERQTREKWILDIAEALTREQGTSSLRMEQLAVRAECSKGTLYQHFTSKEHVVLALAGRHLSEIADLADRLINQFASPLEQMVFLHAACALSRTALPACAGKYVAVVFADASCRDRIDPTSLQAYSRQSDRLDATLAMLVKRAHLLGELPDQGESPDTVQSVMRRLLNDAMTDTTGSSTGTRSEQLMLRSVLRGLQWVPDGADLEVLIDTVSAQTHDLIMKPSPSA